MKIMHKPPINARIKVEEYLEKDGKQLVEFAYGSRNEDERRFYVGIAYKPVNSNNDNNFPQNRYDVVTYDNDEDTFRYIAKDLYYEIAFYEVGRLIRMATLQNK